MKGTKLFVFILFCSFMLFAREENSFINMSKLEKLFSDKIKKLENKEEKVKKVSASKNFIPMNLSPLKNAPKVENKLEEKNSKESSDIKLLGVILGKKGIYKAALIEINGEYLFLREGEKDDFFSLKVESILKDKVKILLKKKRIVLEVSDE